MKIFQIVADMALLLTVMVFIWAMVPMVAYVYEWL